MKGKAIIFSAPSGSGKSTLVNAVLQQLSVLEFSTSATTRNPRGAEVNGKDYYFYSVENFKKLISENELLEYEEVYEGVFYGTLKSELDRIWNAGKAVIFDVDVVGGVNLKKILGSQALSVFIKAPGLEELKRRLIQRGTDDEKSIEKRLSKASFEMSFEQKFDITIVNDQLDQATLATIKAVESFLKVDK